VSNVRYIESTTSESTSVVIPVLSNTPRRLTKVAHMALESYLALSFIPSCSNPTMLTDLFVYSNAYAAGHWSRKTWFRIFQLPSALLM
jgi:hypothetical protein